jgi:hypothetical protein
MEASPTDLVGASGLRLPVPLELVGRLCKDVLRNFDVPHRTCVYNGRKSKEESPVSKEDVNQGWEG